MWKKAFVEFGASVSIQNNAQRAHLKSLKERPVNWLQIANNVNNSQRRETWATITQILGEEFLLHEKPRLWYLRKNKVAQDRTTSCTGKINSLSNGRFKKAIY